MFQTTKQLVFKWLKVRSCLMAIIGWPPSHPLIRRPALRRADLDSLTKPWSSSTYKALGLKSAASNKARTTVARRSRETKKARIKWLGWLLEIPRLSALLDEVFRIVSSTAFFETRVRMTEAEWPQHKTPKIRRMVSLFSIPVVPHKAVAEVSKIGNL